MARSELKGSKSTTNLQRKLLKERERQRAQEQRELEQLQHSNYDEELGELAQAVRKGTRAQQLHEFGDVLAWLASLANQLDISLDEAIERYVTDPP